MEDEKNTRTFYERTFGWLPKIPLNRKATETPDSDLAFESTSGAEVVKNPAQRQKSKKPWWIKALRLLVVTLLVLGVKFYFWGGTPVDAAYEMKMVNDPDVLAEGSACDLFRELKAQQSALLDTPGEKILYHTDTVAENGVRTTMEIKTTVGKGVRLGNAADVNLDDLIHFEILTQQQARLVFSDGTCDVYDLGGVLRLVQEKDKCHLFQAITQDGVTYEYFNIMYTESFEKIKCEEGTFYRARLSISKAKCPAGNSLVNCGTDFFSRHVYNKLRKQLEFMDPNVDYKYRREYELYPCKCVGAEDSPAVNADQIRLDPEAPTTIVINEETDLEALFEGMVLDTIEGER
ncbi:hypothetical protein [Flavilitoribacter nigricans]|uniref:Uncharacterized protein n=1 Tax=Flavilitoribacter nigricans (strain ATCC 23147 / DSM 23189 / NBRC 102662 / NCIMB 1420 / SS-2) TaxID=1122177 RepID=A0A2D0N014_FLAN2|nr:hypothetical protein [Flavilitoribacter nigricans]PHN01882.1 hypothetical protein CRP01_35185 [Flavilitoribacter nigricans DSM 23189 = NBRC 102662]